MNSREGLDASQDTLPQRMLREPLSTDPGQRTVPLNEMLHRYHTLRGYEQDGTPSKKPWKSSAFRSIPLPHLDPVQVPVRFPNNPHFRADLDTAKHENARSRTEESASLCPHSKNGGMCSLGFIQIGVLKSSI